MVVARVLVGGNGESEGYFSKYRVSAWGYEKVLEINDGGSNCIRL